MPPPGFTIIKIKNTNPSCSIVSELSGISAVAVITVGPNPSINFEVTVSLPLAGIVKGPPSVSLPINAPPSSLILYCTPVAPLDPMFSITVLTLNNPPVRGLISSIGTPSMVAVVSSSAVL